MKKSLAGRLLLVATSAVLSMSLTACNTVEGAGEDTQNAGKSLERAAERNK